MTLRARITRAQQWGADHSVAICGIITYGVRFICVLGAL